MKTLLKMAFACLLGHAVPAIADSLNPSVVGNVQAQGQGSSVAITWNRAWDNVGVEGYNVYRNGDYLATVLNTNRYTDRSTRAGQQYRYAVVAFDRARNFSTMSATSTASSSGASAPSSGGQPAVPTQVKAFGVNSSTIRVTWNSPSGDAEAFNIYKNGQYFTTVRGSNAYDARNLNANQSYNFQVVAIRANKFSNMSQVAFARASTAPTSSPPPPQIGGELSPPTGLQASVRNSSSVQLTWNAPQGGARGYNINMNGQYLDTVIGRSNFIVTGLDSSVYRFSVDALRDGNISRNSNEVRISTSSSSASTAPAPAMSNYGGNVPDGYVKVFSEEFDRMSIDESLWSSRHLWGKDLIINQEQQFYVDILDNPEFGVTPFKFNGDKLTIEATRTPDWLRENSKQQQYLSGVLTTFGKFQMRYGYVEMRAMVPSGKGLWPAFWLHHANNWGSRPEIDIMELLAENPRMVYQTYHYYDEQGELQSSDSYEVPGPDYSSDFHTYGMLWEPNKITWYVDGVKTHVYESDKVSNEDMYLLINLALGGTWGASPDSSTPFPAQYQIDYVRAYQKR